MIIDFAAEIDRFGIDVRGVLHVGAHEGQEDEHYRALNATPVYIEANPRVYERLRRHCPNRECHQVAISDRVGTANFHVTSMDQSSSLLELGKHSKIYPDIVQTEQIEVQCTTINELFRGRYDEFEMMNLDIQGAELMAMKGATEVLPHLSCILTEVNRDELYKGCATMDQIDDFLMQFDFCRVKAAFPYHKSWGDAFYVKRSIAAASGWRPSWTERLSSFLSRRRAA